MPYLNMFGHLRGGQTLRSSDDVLKDVGCHFSLLLFKKCTLINLLIYIHMHCILQSV